MEFGPVAVDEALGAILAHSLALPDGRLRKGVVLGPREIERLSAAGVAKVTVARLGPEDVGEDLAALRLAEALVGRGQGIKLQPVGTGRVNILADQAGIAVISPAAVNSVNATDPAITLATVPEWHRLERGAMIATVKIVAYAVQEARLKRAEILGRSGIGLAPPLLKRAHLIETEIAGSAAGPKGAEVCALRLARLGAELTGTDYVAHDEAVLAQALSRADPEAELLLILTGSATSDLRDTAPAALRLAGGEVVHFGLPVDPGNLLFIGTLKGRPVVGLPGCARSIALNGADWVLERLICGQRLTARDLTGMGVGGLLKEMPERPRPRRSLASAPDKWLKGQ